ncbi:hypothetical protein HK103_002510 [Boothiomyces macroporosus]|uniref:Alpha/beta hydrolase fold-3 domain-containing protein n=1 Tax=Boothiomyces macroporosus TaxID=261099 RepID=A0AAD5UIW2_9FUNG|nr:hypothetical protein HK103_002510 [Boothiomyces macroporosus]
MKGDTPNIVEGQRVTSIPNIVPWDAVQISQSFPSNKNVIEFIKKNAPGEWVPHSESIVDICGDWIHPKSTETNRILYFIHGGGHFLGSSNMYRRTAYQAAKSCNAKSFVVNYRLAPQNPYPIPIIDLVSGYLALIENSDPSQIIFIGDSAGGNLVASTLLVIRDMGLPMPAGAMMISPYMDLTHDFPSWKDNIDTDFLPDLPIDSRGDGRLRYYAPNYLLKEPYVSPSFAKDFTRLPPLLIQAGGGERLLDCIVEFVAKISADSKSSVTFEVYNDHVHVFQFLDYCPGAKESFKR